MREITMFGLDAPTAPVRPPASQGASGCLPSGGGAGGGLGVPSVRPARLSSPGGLDMLMEASTVNFMCAR